MERSPANVSRARGVIRSVAIGVAISNLLLSQMHGQVSCLATGRLCMIGFGLSVFTVFLGVLLWRSAELLFFLTLSALITAILHFGMTHL